MSSSARNPRDYLLLYVNGTPHELRGERVFQSLSDFLRRDLGLVGTKIVCAEGDCGACAVLVGKPDAKNKGRLRYSAADSCILFLWQLDRCHVVTVEGLASNGHLHPVQQAMVDCHGSQCGFCTPGFVMQLTDLLAGRDDAVSTDDVRLALSGSLCRCTGYDPIVKAACSIAGEVDDLNELYPPQPMLADFAEIANLPIEISAPSALPLSTNSMLRPRHFFAPTTLEEAVRIKTNEPGVTIISGGTELGVRINKQQVDPAVVMTLTSLPAELEQVSVKAGTMQIGGRASWTTIERACEEHLPEFANIIRLFGGPAIRNVATMAGNIANGSPIADGLPVMMVMEGTLELVSAKGRRKVPINGFYRGYKQMDLRPDELIAAIRLPLPKADELLKLYKVSKRRDLDISTFAAAVWIRLRGEQIEACRIAYGGVAPTVVRLPKAEAFLVNQAFDEGTFRAAGRIARSEVTPISDVRGSRDYRGQLCENILMKFFYDACETASVA